MRVIPQSRETSIERWGEAVAAREFFSRDTAGSHFIRGTVSPFGAGVARE